MTSGGYNVVDALSGTANGYAGWNMVAEDKSIGTGFANLPISPTTFRLTSDTAGVGAAGVITNRPAGYPTTDFYGDPIEATSAAAGAVQSSVDGSGYYLDLIYNKNRGEVTVNNFPWKDELYSDGSLTLVAEPTGDYELREWLKDGIFAGNDLTLEIQLEAHTRVEAIFVHVIEVTELDDTTANNGYEGSLRRAIYDAKAPAVIRFADNVVTPGVSTITLAGRLSIDKSLYIEGGSVTLTKASSYTLFNNDSQLLFIDGFATTVHISRIHFKDGRATGGGSAIRKNNGNLTLESCIFSGGTGGNNTAVYQANGLLTIRGCTFYGINGGTLSGAAIYWDGGTVTITGNLFFGNSGNTIVRPLTGMTSGGYNVVDKPFGTTATTAGWGGATLGTGDVEFTGVGFADNATFPFKIVCACDDSCECDPCVCTAFVPLETATDLRSHVPAGLMPAVDFYGNARDNPGAPGAVK
jgi:hypothetical protein